MKVYFMVIVLLVLILDIKLYIAGIMEEMFKKEILMWLHITLNITNATIMVTYLGNIEA